MNVERWCSGGSFDERETIGSIRPIVAVEASIDLNAVFIETKSDGFDVRLGKAAADVDVLASVSEFSCKRMEAVALGSLS